MSSQARRRRRWRSDPANDLFWRFDMRRLTAEEVRDSILAVSGKLNLEDGRAERLPDDPAGGAGRPVGARRRAGATSPPEEAGPAERLRPRQAVAAGADPRRASTLADTDSSCPVRFATTQPTQALGMLNGEFLNEQAEALGRRGCDARPATTRRRRCALALRLVTRPRARRGARSTRGVEFVDDAARRATGSTPDEALRRVLPAGAEPERVRVPGLTMPSRRQTAPMRRASTDADAIRQRSAAAPAASSSGRPAAGFAGAGAGRPARGDGFFGRAGRRRRRPRRSSSTRWRRSRRTSPAKAKSVIFLFMYGGPSHVDTFDYKPKLYRARRQDDRGEDVRPRRAQERGPRRRAEVEVQAVRPVRQVGQRPVPAPRHAASTTSRSSTR